MAEGAEVAVDLEGVSKAYRIYAHPRHRLLEALWRGRRSYHQDFWALRDVTFRVPRGSTLGIIGLNGSGKSTLLQVIAGIVRPTSGRVAVTGRIASLLELGAGFNPEFTGRENVLMQGAITGFGREETLERLPAIEAFAGIGDFIDQPVKTYSSGMFVRLAFAAAVHVDPEILLVDEALAVGDIAFQLQCIRRIKALQEAGTTILFVSHDTNAVKTLCGAAIFLDRGRLVTMGPADDTVNQYLSLIAAREARAAASPYRVLGEERGALAEQELAYRPAGDLGRPDEAHPDVYREDPDFPRRPNLFRHGTGDARIQNVELLDECGRPTDVVEFDRPVTLRVHIEFLKDVSSPVLGFLLRDRLGVDILGINTFAEGVPLGDRKAGEKLVVDFTTRLPLRPGYYSVAPALAYDAVTPRYLDWVDNALIFLLSAPSTKMPIYGLVYLNADIRVHQVPSASAFRVEPA